MWLLIGTILISLLVTGIYQIPSVKFNLEWRIDATVGIVRGWIFPHDVLPTQSGATAITAPPTYVPSPTSDVLQSDSNPNPAPTSIT